MVDSHSVGAGSGAGAWYRGDLHVHSRYSDGDSSVAEVLEAAERSGLDFIALTDHDSRMGGRPRHWDDRAYRSDRLVLLYGIEWSTRAGHANIWCPHPFPYDGLWPANRATDAEAAVRLAHERGALFSVNHPWSRDTSWRLDVPRDVDCVEVWNAPFLFPNRSHRSVREFYHELLRRGLRPSAVGGSDSHSLKGYQADFNSPGSPTTWVHALERSPEGILAGIKAGHASVSYSPDADRLDLCVDADGDGACEHMGGDAIAAGRPATFRAALHRPSPSGGGRRARRAVRCLIIRNGKVVARAVLRRDGDYVEFRDTPEAGAYYRAELRGLPEAGLLQKIIYGRTLALTNPIHVVAPG